ncbi:MAG: hypothetical protein JNN30_08505 [Rhodanobacteraceae bacterium]|nr:hypothetical protein [Rhodanobacteraceae bacterium]
MKSLCSYARPLRRALFHCGGLLLASMLATAPAGSLHAASLSAGNALTCGIDSETRLQCWGDGYPGDGSGGSQAAVPVLGAGIGVRQVDVGGGHACAVLSDGRLRCWGSNGRGQIGDNSTAARATPADVAGFASGTLDVSAGNEHTCAISAAGAVQCWGLNTAGQVGDNSTTNRRVPVLVAGLGSSIAVAAGGAHSCALSSAGGVHCWGDNSRGQLGDGTTLGRLTPIAVSGLSSGVSAIVAGSNYSCALLTSGGVRCWGGNTDGQLGDGSTTDRMLPAAIIGIGSIVELSAGSTHTCARSTSGTLWCWGLNSRGQLGDNTTTDRYSPTPVNGQTSGVTAIATGSDHSCLRRSNHEVRCFGYRHAGRLGDGLGSGRVVPVPVRISSLPAPADRLAAGSVFNANHLYGQSCARTVEGAAWCWGSNYESQIGDGVGYQLGDTKRLGPTPVLGYASGTIDVSAGFAHSCLLTTAGAVKCWGDNEYGQVGDNSSTDRVSPQDVIGASTQITQFDAGATHSCARTSGGGVRCWGRNDHGQIGDGTGIDRRVATNVAGALSGMAQVSAGGSHSCAVTAAGTVRCWGDNAFGQLGDGTIASQTTPVAVTGLSGVSAVQCGQLHTCAQLTNGAVKCWGNNQYGQLGDGTITNALVPVDVVGLGPGSTTQLSAGGAHTCAFGAAGALTCWGANNDGQLGDGTTGNRAVPTPVSGMGSGVIAVAAGGDHSCAARGNSVYCFGRGSAGQIGNGHSGDHTTPTQVSIWRMAGDLIFRDGFQ